MGPLKLNNSDNQLGLSLGPRGLAAETSRVKVASTHREAGKDRENKSLAKVWRVDG